MYVMCVYVHTARVFENVFILGSSVRCRGESEKEERRGEREGGRVVL